MDPVVTARVPAGVRDRGVDVLREIGSSTSELVNAAFDYVIQVRALPKPQHAGPASGQRILGAEQRAQLHSFMDGLRVPIPSSWEEASFGDLFDQAIEDRYANLR